jgi:hypothetical protein
MTTDPNSPLWRWAALIAGLAALILVLALIFPRALEGPGDWTLVGYSVGLVLLLAAGGLRFRAGSLRSGLRHAVIWLAIFGGLTLLVTFVQSRGV